MKGSKALQWCREHENLVKAFIMMWFPLLCGMMTCALEGRSISEVYLPASEWNDELFYYKQVEGILNYGFPQGYFGFNESHALKLSFAAWSPVLVLPWIAWGLLFGWNLMSPIYCNIVLMMLGMFLFVMLVNPKGKQLLSLAVLMAAFTPMTRFMLSGMPEVICFFMVIVFLAVAINYSRVQKGWKLAVLFGMAVLMTLMRPYLLLFMILPGYYRIRCNKRRGIAETLLIVGITGGIYVWINHYLSAEYLTPLFDVTWIKTFFTEGILEGVKFTLYKLWDTGKTVWGMMIQAFISGYHAGTQFDGFVWLLLILLYQSWKDFRKKDRTALEIHLFLVICFVGMFAAVLLMYKPIQGGRHLQTFIMVGIFILSIMETHLYRRIAFTGALFVYLYMVMATDRYEHQIPYADEKTHHTLASWEQVFQEELILETESVPNYDNVLIWTLSDMVDGNAESLKWQELYAVPAGFGISCCEGEYIREHFEELQSKYLAVPKGGALDLKCREKMLREIGQSEEVIVYELR